MFMKTYTITRKKENMRCVSKLKHNTYWVGYFVDHELNRWRADARWACDGYLIERQGWYGNGTYTVYTKWWWEKLTNEERKETLKRLDHAINTMTEEWWVRVDKLIKKECKELRNRINNTKISEVHEHMENGMELPYPCLCFQGNNYYESDKRGCVKNFKFLSKKMKRPKNIIKYELRKTSNGSYNHQYLEKVLANYEEDAPWRTWEDYFINEKKKIIRKTLNRSRWHNWKGHEKSYFIFSQLKTIKKTLERTGKVVKVERSKEIKTLYGAVEFIETLESPYKRKQLNQIVYYKPKKWVQALLGI